MPAMARVPAATLTVPVLLKAMPLERVWVTAAALLKVPALSKVAVPVHRERGLELVVVRLKVAPAALVRALAPPLE